jgi:hypothetical protein
MNVIAENTNPLFIIRDPQRLRLDWATLAEELTALPPMTWVQIALPMIPGTTDIYRRTALINRMLYYGLRIHTRIQPPYIYARRRPEEML